WETIAAAAGHVGKFIAQIIQAVAKFSQTKSGDTWRGGVTGISGALVAFKGVKTLPAIFNGVFRSFGLLNGRMSGHT
ncbi:hypothetical protein ACJBQZ_12700, partial [Streptococcus suis]